MMGSRTFKSVLAGSVCALALSTVAKAQDAKSFDVPAGDLAPALDAYIKQSGEQLIYRVADVRGMKTSGVRGALSSDEALQQLLAGTALKVQRDPSGLIAIASIADPQSSGAAGDGAEGTVQALIVTAQKREENIQDVPIAMSAFSQEDLTKSQVAGGADLMTQVPNFTFTKTNFSGYSIQIRGIGTQAISATTDPAVAVAFNNTPFLTNHFFEQEFYDLERVEVLRGPQGTLYGRNATAGVVNVISAKPKNHYEAKLSGDVSNYKSSRLEGMVNIPLVEDKAALRIAGAWTKRDGYVKNLLTGQQTDGRDLWSSRVTLGLNPTDKLSINLIWEHFNENDDRLRSGKQLCRTDPGPSKINGITPQPGPAVIDALVSVGYVSQGCLPTSLYSPDAFQTPNGYALPYYGPLGVIGSPVYFFLDPYVSTTQSKNLREIETHLKPDYEASNDTGELQIKLDLPYHLTFASETGFSRDRSFSFEDYNRFDTRPGVFIPGERFGPNGLIFFPGEGVGDRTDIVSAQGVFCDPQLGCTDRLAAGDLATSRSRQFSQEFRVSSDFDGPFNFSVGANFLRYDTEVKYYVFINTITAWQATIATERGDYLGSDGVFHSNPRPLWVPGVYDASECVANDFFGPVISNPNTYYEIGCAYIDPNDIHHLNDEGRNYFLSRNPYHLLSYAAFGEAYYNITPNLKLTAGLRWTVDKKTAPQIPSWLLAGHEGGTSGGSYDHWAPGSYGNPVRKVIEQEWREPTGRLALDWKPDVSFTDETLVYASYVRGYKAGGANPPPPMVVFANVCPPDCQGGGLDFSDRIVAASLTHPETFKPEFVNAYELGTKNTLLDGRLTANLSGFYYDYTGYQISQIVDRAAVNLNFDAKIWGAELELDWRPLENLRFGFKGGYESTRLADGSKAIDLMDRTAGQPGWMVFRPFATMPSNCIVPTWLATVAWPQELCAAYITGLDPVTGLPYVPDPTVSLVQPLPAGYPGYNPDSAPNRGEGFLKDLSGHQLPNAPKYTATITADYTLLLPNDWLMTLHTDLYRQAEAWTRVFNTPGYDKLKAYSNVNVAAIFSNEDEGWQVMAYVKNVFDKDNITGAFLNSDDTGLTTNVFLNEPRLYGLRVTKNWSGGAGWIARPHTAGQPYPFWVELGAQGQRVDAPAEAIMPFPDAHFSKTLDPTRAQNEDLDWTHSPEVKFTYQPSGSPWKIAAGVRYGRTSNQTGPQRRTETTGDPVCADPTSHAYIPFLPGVDFGFVGKLRCDPSYGPVTKTITSPYGSITQTFQNKYDPSNLLTATDRVSTSTDRLEEHVIADFSVGKDVGLGVFGEGKSSLAAGLRYASFNSSVSGDMRGIPDMTVPAEAWGKYNTTFHQYIDAFSTQREFKGAGPTVSWDASRPVWGNDETGHLNVDWTLTGGVLFGRQKTKITGTQGSTYFDAIYPANPPQYVVNGLLPPIQTPMNIAPRDKMAAVPVLDLSLGLSYEVPGIKLSTGYRWERYFNVLDAGFADHKSYDRTLDGPYVKIAVGFGG
jgi:iron complex outermembrane receptor protein